MATVLHVGFHETGTTMLQGHFFPSLPNCAVVGPENPGFELFRPLARDLTNAPEQEFRPDDLREFLQDLRGYKPTLIVTHEWFSKFRSGGRTQQRLKAVLGEAKVLVCVRDQRTLLYSRWGGYLRKGGKRAFEAYVDGLEPDWLCFDDVVQSYHDLFGSDQVRVLPYELLARDPARYLAELRAFVVPAAPPPAEVLVAPVSNRGLAPPTRWAIRHANRLFVANEFNPRPPLRFVPGGASVSRKLARLDGKVVQHFASGLGRRDRAVADRIGRGYAEGNDRLARLTGLPLREYGYPLTEGALATDRR